MIVMIEEIPGALKLQRAAPMLERVHIHVRRAWVQHRRDAEALLGNRIYNPHEWLFMGLPLGIASEEEWNRLLLLEGSKRVTALDWPPLMTDLAAGQAIPVRIPDAALKHMTKYVA